MPHITLSTKGQLVIPREVRQAQGWTAGTQLELSVADGVVMLRRRLQIVPTTLAAGFGMLCRDAEPIDDAAAQQAVDAMMAAEWRR
jgi:AbrB family looped-hinge helix DNA binding protein